MPTNHADIARRAFGQITLPEKPRPVPSVLPYLVRVLELLPPAEQYGYVKAPPGGENTTTLPDGTLIRVGRVMTPDGQLYKVMNDVPNGGPQWVAEDIRPELYVPFWNDGATAPLPDGPPPPLPVSLDAVYARLDAVERKVRDLENLHKEVHAQIGALNQQAAAIDAAHTALLHDVSVLATEVHTVPPPQPPTFRPPTWWPFR